MADDKTPATIEERLARMERVLERVVDVIDRDRPRYRDRDRDRDRDGRTNVLGLEARLPGRRDVEQALETLSLGMLRFRDRDRNDDWDR